MSTPARITIGGATLNQTPLDWSGNERRIAEAIALARSQGIQLLCLPELCITGYGCEDLFYSADVARRAWQVLLRLLPHTHDMAVAVGLPLHAHGRVYNCAAVLANGELLAMVPKQYMAGDGLHYEPRWFKPWPAGEVSVYEGPDGTQVPLGDLVLDLSGVRVGFEICEDSWNGTRTGTSLYLRNADVVLNPSASHFAFGKTKTRQSIVVEGSRMFMSAYVLANLLGNEAGRSIYDGEILIAQNGQLLAQNTRFGMAEVQVQAATVVLDGPRLARRRSVNAPHTADDGVVPYPLEWLAAGPVSAPIAPQELSKEEEFYLAETLALWDYARKSASRGYTLSLSGGADSSCCAVLAAHAYRRAAAELSETELIRRLAYWRGGNKGIWEKEWLACAYQGTSNSSQDTLNSARELAAELGAAFQNWDVEPLVQQYHAMATQAIGRPLSWDTDDIALQNIQARLRAPGIWFWTNLRGSLLIATSNRSEAATGYATMDGDTAGGVSPLAGIDKPFLLQWLRWAETALGIASLHHVNSLIPTAELRPKEKLQTDEADLMPYPLLNAIEACMVRDSLSPAETWQALRGGTWPDSQLRQGIVRFYRLWSRNQWKRERYAPSFHLDDRNLDPRSWRRFPILSGGYEQELKELKELEES